MPVDCNFSELCTAGHDVRNPVHQHFDGTWWFYTETWHQEYGPYDSQDACEKDVNTYARECLGSV